tara:strand:- start:741 stop:1520 length:780 start_codon:yes stop_codon:yes gene_type:complete
MKKLFESWRGFVNESDYMVRSGDNLTKIAKANNLTLQQLLNLNPQYKNNPNLIKVGQKIKLSQEDEDTGYDPEIILSELEHDIQELFVKYYESNLLFKNNLRDCVAFKKLLDEDKFDKEPLPGPRALTPKQSTQEGHLKAWKDALWAFVRDHRGDQDVITAFIRLGYDQKKSFKTLKDISAATMKYVTEFTYAGGGVFDENKSLKYPSGNLDEKVKAKAKLEADTYLKQDVRDSRFKRGTIQADIFARYGRVRIRRGKS